MQRLASRYRDQCDALPCCISVVELPGLRRFRVNAALSQRELARLSGVAASTIARIELGAPAQPATTRRLAEALHCQPRELIEPEP